MILACVNLKGGVGKTTTSVYLAALAARSGMAAVIADADPQASAAEWLEAAPIDGVATIETTSVRQLRAGAGRVEPGELLVIDAPPGDTPPGIIRAAIELADYVVIPTRPGGLEPVRVFLTVDMLPADKPAGVVIVGARNGTTNLRATVAVHEAGSRPLLGIVPERSAVQAGPSAGLSRDGLAAYASVLGAILAQLDGTETDGAPR